MKACKAKGRTVPLHSAAWGLEPNLMVQKVTSEV